MGGRGGRWREGGRESNRCVNAFLLECTVYHKTHTHTTWSPQLIKFFLVQVAAGDSHTAALSDTGTVYAWGIFRVR